MDATKSGRPDALAPAASSASERTPQQLLQARIATHWVVVSRLVLVQLGCSLLMQLSYVAFPAYNVALALWCLACCTPTYVAKHARLVPLHLFAVAVSVVTDVVWMSLWVSGRVFFDQFCSESGVSIVSCGGPTDHFPGCQTNRFALFMLIVNDVAKVAMLATVVRVRSLTGSSASNSDNNDHHHHRHHHHHHHGTHTDASASSLAGTANANAVRQMPTAMLPARERDPQRQV